MDEDAGCQGWVRVVGSSAHTAIPVEQLRGQQDNTESFRGSVGGNAVHWCRCQSDAIVYVCVLNSDHWQEHGLTRYIMQTAKVSWRTAREQCLAGADCSEPQGDDQAFVHLEEAGRVGGWG